MNAKEIIAELEQFGKQNEVRVILPADIEVGTNFGCDSWRGSYSYPAALVEVGQFYTVEECINNLNEVNGLEVTGYKGGDYTLSEDDNIFLVRDFSSSGGNTTIESIYEHWGVVYLTVKTDAF